MIHYFKKSVNLWLKKLLDLRFRKYDFKIKIKKKYYHKFIILKNL